LIKAAFVIHSAYREEAGERILTLYSTDITPEHQIYLHRGKYENDVEYYLFEKNIERGGGPPGEVPECPPISK